MTLCGNYGVFNVGDEAILAGLESLIKKTDPAAEISVMGKGSLLPFGLRSCLKSIFSRRMRKPRLLVKSCDVFILGGGGLFTDEEGPAVSLFWALHGLYAHWVGKPVYCIGISVGKIRFWNKFFVKKLFGVSKAVTVRDKASFELLKKWGIKCVLATDLALALTYEIKDSDQRKNYIVISARRFKNSDKILYKELAQLCDYVIEKHGFNVRLLPFQSGGQFDEYILHKIFEHAKHKENIKIEPFTADLDKILNILGNAKAVIAMRLHAGILSLVTETPFIPLTYMQKVSDFWAECDYIKPLSILNNADDLSTSFDSLILVDSDRKGILTLNKEMVKRKLVNEQAIKSALSN